MKTFVHSIVMVVVSITLIVSTVGCVGQQLLGPPEKCAVYFINNLPDRIILYSPDNKITELGPNGMYHLMLPTSVESSFRWTYPDGRGGRTIRFTPDAELGDAVGPNGFKTDTIVYASGAVIR